MADPTVSEIDAQIAELQRQRDIKSLEGSQAVAAALKAGKVATLAEDLEALIADLSPASMAYQQARNVISVITNTRNLIDGDVARIQSIVDAQTEA
ncbi:hypothetical protein [Novosphingobium sp.]|uniref:hypothetical protein n=1 Tax=Novosphingobium sp. TaxID=1874826 RepID=UPI0028AE7CD4|nr:hypothetical protein [Novosphingobium sp.]